MTTALSFHTTTPALVHSAQLSYNTINSGILYKTKVNLEEEKRKKKKIEQFLYNFFLSSNFWSQYSTILGEIFCNILLDPRKVKNINLRGFFFLFTCAKRKSIENISFHISFICVAQRKLHIFFREQKMLYLKQYFWSKMGVRTFMSIFSSFPRTITIFYSWSVCGCEAAVGWLCVTCHDRWCVST